MTAPHPDPSGDSDDAGDGGDHQHPQAPVQQHPQAAVGRDGPAAGDHQHPQDTQTQYADDRRGVRDGARDRRLCGGPCPRAAAGGGRPDPVAPGPGGLRPLARALLAAAADLHAARAAAAAVTGSPPMAGGHGGDSTLRIGEGAGRVPARVTARLNARFCRQSQTTGCEPENAPVGAVVGPPAADGDCMGSWL